MKMRKLRHLHTFHELGEMLSVPQNHLKHLFGRTHLNSVCWVWRDHWPEPRFPDTALPEWLRLLDQFPVGTFRGDPPELERPTTTFRESRRGATKSELQLFLKAFPEREQKRVQAMK